MNELLSNFENKEIDFWLHSRVGRVKVKDIQFAIDDVNLFKEENNLDINSLRLLDDFVHYAESLNLKLSEMRKAYSSYNKSNNDELSRDRVIDCISSIPIQQDVSRKWKTYILIDKDSDFVKIGKTENIERRVTEIKNNSGRNLDLLHLFDADIELRLHTVFKDFRKNGEWFQIAPTELRKKVEKIKSELQPDIFIN